MSLVSHGELRLLPAPPTLLQLASPLFIQGLLEPRLWSNIPLADVKLSRQADCGLPLQPLIIGKRCKRKAKRGVFDGASDYDEILWYPNDDLTLSADDAKIKITPT